MNDNYLDEINQAKNAFNFFKKDPESEVIDKSDIEELFKSLNFNFNEKEVEKSFKRNSKNGDGKIGIEFFEEIVEENNQMSKEEKFKELNEMFKFVDKKGNNRMKMSDFENILRIFGKEILSEDEIKILTESSDIDGDNFIETEEFIKIMMNI